MGLLNDMMVSADCAEFVECMKSIYVAAKRNSSDNGYMEYIDIAEDEYCTLYRSGKWIKSVDTSEAGFVGNDDGYDGRTYNTGGRGGCGGRGCGCDGGR